MLGNGSLRINVCLHGLYAQVLLLREVIRVRLLGKPGDLFTLIDVSLPILLNLLLHDLILNVLLLGDETMLSHHLFVEDGRLLLEAGLEEPLAHHLNDLIDSVALQAGELYPLPGEAWAHLDAVLEV